MNRSQLLRELRVVLNDATVNGLWEEESLWLYLAEGQDKFCEDTGLFRDISNFTITLQTGVAIYTIPSRVIEILDIWDGTRKLEKILYGEGDDLVSQTGDPRLWRTDQELGAIKFYPTPTSDQNGDVFTLNVWRYSISDLADDGVVPELPNRLQWACIEWAAYKAFMNHDMEAQDPVKARDHLEKYHRYVKDGVKYMRRAHNIETRVGTDPAYRV